MFTFLTANLRTNQIHAEIPMAGGTQIGKVLNGTGTVEGGVPIGDPDYDRLDLLTATEPNMTALYVDYDGTIIWGGMIWGRRYNSDENQLRITAVEFMSYFVRRFLTVNSTTLFAKENVDSALIVRKLIEWAQDQEAGNLLIQIGNELSGDLVDVEWKGFEYKQIAEAITEVSEMDDGFDVTFECRWGEDGNPARYLVLDVPRRGRTAEESGFIFEKPGNIVRYDYPEDGAEQTTDTYGVGAGEGASMLRTHVSQPQLYDIGYPRLERAESLKDIKKQIWLDKAITRIQRDNQLPVNLMTATVLREPESDEAPAFGQYQEGDEAKFIIEDQRFPERTELTRRIMGWKTTVDAPTVDFDLEQTFT